MTDKQIPNERRQYEYKSVYPEKSIIIDDIDVSGCEFYRNDNGVFAPDGTAERTELCYLTNDYCGNNPNCYFKQLKSKEKECEELKKNYFTVIQQRNKAEKTLTEIKEIIHFNKTNRLSSGACISVEQILQKINEVDNGTNP